MGKFVEVSEGDLFNYQVKGDYITHIAHGCNAFGNMGAGVAAAIAVKFPYTHEQYQAACADTSFQQERVLICKENSHTIYNLYTQHRGGNNAILSMVITSVIAMLDVATADIIVMPAIGCGIGGLDIDDVIPAITNVVESHTNQAEVHFIRNFKQAVDDRI